MLDDERLTRSEELVVVNAVTAAAAAASSFCEFFNVNVRLRNSSTDGRYFLLLRTRSDAGNVAELNVLLDLDASALVGNNNSSI